MTVMDRLQNVDRRVVCTVLFILLAAPILRPIGLPLKITREVQAAFNTLDALKPDSIVMIATAVAPSSQAENEPQTIAVLHHLMAKNARLVIAPVAAEAGRYVDRYADLLKSKGYKEGVNFVVLPYLAGGETLYAAMSTDLKSIYRQVVSSPLWDSIKSIKDVSVFIDVGGGESQRWALAHVEARHKIKMICLITGVILGVIQPFFSSGQLSGFLCGLSGAAEYEVLVKVPGTAAAGMDAQSLGHLWIILLVIVGNLGYIAARKPARNATPTKERE